MADWYILMNDFLEFIDSTYLSSKERVKRDGSEILWKCITNEKSWNISILQNVLDIPDKSQIPFENRNLEM